MLFCLLAFLCWCALQMLEYCLPKLIQNLLLFYCYVKNESLGCSHRSMSFVVISNGYQIKNSFWMHRCLKKQFQRTSFIIWNVVVKYSYWYIQLNHIVPYWNFLKCLRFKYNIRCTWLHKLLSNCKRFFVSLKHEALKDACY